MNVSQPRRLPKLEKVNKRLEYLIADQALCRCREWVAPPIAERAIEILEALSDRRQSRSKRTDRWLCRRESGVTERQRNF
jgi:hypothetical protein